MVKHKRLRRRIFAALMMATSAATALLAACGPGFMDGLVGGNGRTAEGGKSDGGDEGSANTCELTKIPARPPDNGSSGSEPAVDVYFGFEAIRIDTIDGDAGGVPPAQGYDLDDRCTCAGSGAKGARACVPLFDAGPQCDGPNGRDNAIAKMFNAMNDLIPAFEQTFATTRIQNGQYNILVHLERWNGLPDDPEVLVTLFSSQGLDQSPDGGSNRKDPIFDGTDVWTIDPRTLATGVEHTDCRLQDSLCSYPPDRVARGLEGKAWVANNTLVAKFGRAPLYLRTALKEMNFDFDDLTIVAKLSEAEVNDGAMIRRLDGEILGLWPEDRALSAMGNLESPFDMQQLCLIDGGLFYNETKRAFCSALDLPAAGGNENASCQRMSTAISFRASTMKPPSIVYARTDPPGPCVDFKDSCSK
jgi:hypothetical protein